MSLKDKENFVGILTLKYFTRNLKTLMILLRPVWLWPRGLTSDHSGTSQVSHPSGDRALENVRRTI